MFEMNLIVAKMLQSFMLIIDINYSVVLYNDT